MTSKQLPGFWNLADQVVIDVYITVMLCHILRHYTTASSRWVYSQLMFRIEAIANTVPKDECYCREADCVCYPTWCAAMVRDVLFVIPMA